LTPRIVAALLTVLVLGMWFNATRPLAIAAAAALAFMYPQLLVLVLLGAALAAWYRYSGK
jgi:hypothetical protein